MTLPVQLDRKPPRIASARREAKHHMGASAQIPITAATPTYAKRKARALVGWLSEQDGVLWAAGRDAQEALNPVHLSACQRARASVALRQPGVDQSSLTSE